jgi:hypothetical protein
LADFSTEVLSRIAHVWLSVCQKNNLRKRPNVIR